jgi:hypothetical protein
LRNTLSHQRRLVLHLNVVEEPLAVWTAQQLRQAFPFASPPTYLLRDRDGVYGQQFLRCAEALGLKELRIAPHAPWQSPYVERLIGSLRRIPGSRHRLFLQVGGLHHRYERRAA